MEAPSRNGNGLVKKVAWGAVVALAILAAWGGQYYVGATGKDLAFLRADINAVKVVQDTYLPRLVVVEGSVTRTERVLDRIETRLDQLIRDLQGPARPARR